MSAALLAFLVAGGSSVWVCTKLQNRTGYGNSKAALQGAIIVFIIGFIVIFTIGHIILK